MNAPETRIGPYTLNSRLGRLDDGSKEPPHLRPKSFRVLEVLTARRGTLVSKDELIAEVWADVTVTDESLSQCIRDIRRVLGRDTAHLLRTVPRRGYVLDLEPSSDEESSKRNPVLLVGLAVAAVALIALGIKAFSVGRTHTDDNLPQASADVPDATIRVVDDTNWRNRTANDTLRKEMETAVASDPANAEAWARLGETYWFEVKYSAWGGGRRELDKAFDALEHALALGGGEAYRVLAEIRLEAPYADARSRVDALAMAQAAAKISPRDPDSLIVLAAALTANNRPQDAMPVLESALGEVSVLPDRYREVAGMTYLLACSPSKAVEEFGRLHGAGTFGGTRYYSGWFLAASLAHAGRLERARLLVEEAVKIRPEQTLDAVAVSLAHLEGQPTLEIVLDGLRLAGMPD